MPKKKYPKITKKDLEEGVKKWKEENEWEEFEDELYIIDECGHHDKDARSIEMLSLTFNDLADVFKQFGFEWRNNVKIKARKGEIVIKRIK